MTPQKPNPTPHGPLQVGQIFIWQYEILQLLGSGGHAFVYRARHRFLGHMVAIKVLHRAAGVSLEMLRRGQAEAQIEFQLKHPGIVSVLDGGIDNDGLLYIVMELLQGRSMRDALIELGKLQVIEVLRLGAKVARAIEVAHRAGVVHRDLKPENLFFTRDNQLKVIDFGIAKIDDAAGWQTQKDMVMGTAYYLSPEQVMAQPVTARSDIYALGTIMLEALLGQPPVLRQVGGRPLTFKLLTRIIVTEQLPPLNEIDPRIPAYVDRLLAKSTAKRPEERFASMDELADACEACARTLEADLLQRGMSLTTRELWRKTPSASGVETIGTPSTTPPEHDTAPASRPPFFGGLSSSTVTVVPQSKSVAPPSQAESRSAPTVFGEQPGARNTTAPLGSPRSRPTPAVVAASAPLMSGPGRSGQPPASAPPTAQTASEARRTSSDETGSEPEPDQSSFRPLTVLVWGVAVGILVFGLGALLVLRPKHVASAAPAASFKTPANLASARQVGPISPLSKEAMPPGPGAAALPQGSLTPDSKPAPPRVPPRALTKEPPPASRAADGRSTIF